jgi:hypothetical protein
VLYHPTVVFTYAVVAMACVAAAAHTVRWYSGVTVFNLRVRTPSVTNRQWVAFYAVAAARCACAPLLIGVAILSPVSAALAPCALPCGTA